MSKRLLLEMLTKMMQTMFTFEKKTEVKVSVKGVFVFVLGVVTTLAGVTWYWYLNH